MKKLLLVIIFINCAFLYAQPIITSEYSYRRYTTQDGLPNLLLETVFQDNSGYFWIATYKGFARFDGFNFTPFKSETIINILHLANGKNGDVMAYTYHDVFVVGKDNSVYTVQFAPEDIYLNTYNTRDLPESYLILENETATEKYLVQWQNDTVHEVLRHAELNKILDSKPFLDVQNNKIYLPSLDGLNIYDLITKRTSKIKGLTVENFLRHSVLGLLGFDNDGIYKIIGEKAEKLISCSLGNDKRAMEMADGSIVVKDEKAAYRYKDGKFQQIAKFSTKIMDIFRDMENNLWIATFSGLYNFFQLDFKNYSIEDDVIRNVLEDGENNYWLGTIYGKLLRMENDKAVRINYPPSRNTSSFSFGSANIDGTLYFPRDNDILMYGQKRFSWAGLPYNLEDYDGYLQVVSFGDKILVLRGFGVYLCEKNGKPLHFYSANELKQQDFQYLQTDESQGRWMVAGHGGISIVENDSVRFIKSPNTIQLCIDKLGNVWTGSENRLNLLRGDSTVTVHSFPDDAVQGIFAINRDYILVTTIHNLHFLNITEYLNDGKIQFINYDFNNGFMGLNPQVNVLFIDSKGNCWLPCNDCTVTFNPQELLRKNAPPVLHIISGGTSADNVRWADFDLTARNKFSYKNNSVRFSFIGIKFSAVENVRYRYRLLGFQDDWSEPSKQREISFNNLTPGDYVFEIYADAGTDDSRCEIQSFAFSIKPAFWQRAWFYVVFIGFLMLASAGIAIYFQRRKNRALLEKLRTEKELNELRISSIRLKAIPHFNANVLSAIEYYIANRTKEDAMRILSIYSDFTIQTLSELDKAARPISEELAYVKMYLDLEKIRFLNKFDFQIKVEPEVDKTVPLPNMILHTYCENAVKHGLMPLKSGGLLTISVSQRNNSVCVSVEDNGVGRTFAKQNKDLHSTKQGLLILNRQIEIYNRFNEEKIVQYIEDLDRGTRFTVEVPAGFSYVN
jgi:ligand-binding sensor domain-containing protein